MKLILATWRFALEPIENTIKSLSSNDDSNNVIEDVIKQVEDDPKISSVGYGGLPNKKGFVEQDSAMMDGNSLKIGAVGGIVDIAHPISVSKCLLEKETSNFLVGNGATKFALENGFRKRKMLSSDAKSKFKNKAKEKGHDTIGVICIDEKGKISVGTSTSGLFMKEPGRVGDSPIPGAGFYADSNFGAAVATGLGEEIMRRSICFELVNLISAGLKPQEAADLVINNFVNALKVRKQSIRELSFLVCDKNGNWGAGTTSSHFSFVVCSDKPIVYLAENKSGKTVIKEADQAWIKNHLE
ncbi:MAG: N(4)-(beta-N-acetylglucosaminyl)-L-asparaginase [Clostridia bacterium]|nr:N(4)-(beta-N-acetylglucosaminyl)-L-asparaginase [Clostridia bacterium]